jgi:hypothetical protein
MPEKRELFHMIINPPEAPVEGTYTNSSKEAGQQDLRNALSNSCFLVSYKQITEQPLNLIAFIRASCFDLALSPRIFQHKINHFFKYCI